MGGSADNKDNNNIGGNNNEPVPIDKTNSTTLFVGNLPFNMRENEMGDLFSKFGKIRHVKVGIDKYSGKSRGYGFVEFEDRVDAEAAFKKYNGYDLMGRVLRLDWDLGFEKKREMGYSGERGGDRGGDRGGRGGGGSRRGFGRPMFSRGRRYSPYGGGGRGRSPRRYSRSPPPRRRYSRSPPRRYERNERGYDRYDRYERRPQYSPRRRSPSPRMGGSPPRREAYPGDRRSPAYDRRYSGSPGSPPRGDGRRGGSPPMQDMRQ